MFLVPSLFKVKGTGDTLAGPRAGTWPRKIPQDSVATSIEVSVWIKTHTKC